MVYNLCILACYLICVKGCNDNPAMIFNQAGETAILNCSFYLHSDQIYSVKWYKVNYSQEMSRPLFSGAAPVLLLHASRVSDNEVFPCERDETGRRLDISNFVTTFFSWCCQGATDWSWHQYLGDYQVYLMISRKSRNPSCKMMLNTKLSMTWLQECTCVKWPRPICGTWSGWEIWLLLVGFQLSSSFFDLSQEKQFRWPPTENTIATNYKP